MREERMELSEIEAFVTINRVGGFTRAAGVLHLSQPAISRRIELLERELGAPLFERIPGGVRLSEAGKTFLPYAQQILATVGDGLAAVHGLEEEGQGTIRLVLVGTLASTQLTAQLQAFRTTYPQIRLLLHTARSDEVSTLVLQGDAHLGLRYFIDPRPEIHSQTVTHEPLLVACAAHSHLVKNTPTEPEGVSGVPWVSFPLGSGSPGEPFARILERLLLRWGLEEAERIIIDSLTAQKRLIEADFGIGLVPASSIEEELRLGTLRVLPIEALQTEAPVMVIHRRQAYLSRAVRLLLVMLTHQAESV
ncbi:LysR family transcriptional regulator [Ktedonosporobacter rubrisoli]|uniref:LysR family transcriptional regulator n=1 Tax=Ktedonosporobacter rubrisoli TaxID=2509675 RepID=A0A4P6JMA9_KTERU|nr:LysR family transcriptional regulator [Ktedonosporobacter rubrisoli]QBD76253.1 LysR family transcriptional regulator [Ktedonosporobacter rubrisoli]